MTIGMAVLDLTARIYKEFKFDPSATDVATPLTQVLQQKRGVCQDFAHLQIACLRSLGKHAFVSDNGQSLLCGRCFAPRSSRRVLSVEDERRKELHRAARTLATNRRD